MVDKLALGTPDLRSLADLEVGEVAGDVTLLVCLALGAALVINSP